MPITPAHRPTVYLQIFSSAVTCSDFPPHTPACQLPPNPCRAFLPFGLFLPANSVWVLFVCSPAYLLLPPHTFHLPFYLSIHFIPLHTTDFSASTWDSFCHTTCSPPSPSHLQDLRLLCVYIYQHMISSHAFLYTYRLLPTHSSSVQEDSTTTCTPGFTPATHLQHTCYTTPFFTHHLPYTLVLSLPYHLFHTTFSPYTDTVYLLTRCAPSTTCLPRSHTPYSLFTTATIFSPGHDLPLLIHTCSYTHQPPYHLPPACLPPHRSTVHSPTCTCCLFYYALLHVVPLPATTTPAFSTFPLPPHTCHLHTWTLFYTHYLPVVRCSFTCISPFTTFPLGLFYYFIIHLLLLHSTL